MTGKNQNSGPRGWKPSAKLIFEVKTPLFGSFFMVLGHLYPQSPQNISLAHYFDNSEPTPLSQHLHDAGKGCVILVIVQKQEDFVSNSSTTTIRRILWQLNSHMGGSGSNPGFLIYLIFPDPSLPLWWWCLNISLHTKVVMLSDAALADTPAEHQTCPLLRLLRHLCPFEILWIFALSTSVSLPLLLLCVDVSQSSPSKRVTLIS